MFATSAPASTFSDHAEGFLLLFTYLNPKYRKMSHLSCAHFRKGDLVEVLKRENGPSTSTYYAAKVLRSNVKQRNQIFVEYQTMIIIGSGCQKCVTELVDLASVRPMPPRELNKCFRMGDSVDVYCDNAWQKGTIKDILENSKYIVRFHGKSEGIVAEQCYLRLHREWDDGSWVPPLPEQVCLCVHVLDLFFNFLIFIVYLFIL